MMRRLRWLWLIAATGCYFETPTYGASEADSQAVDPVDMRDGGQPEDDDGSTLEGDGETGTMIEPSEGGMDAASDANTPKPNEAGPGPANDARTDTGISCNCDAGRSICLSSGSCAQCTADNKTACTGATPACDVASGNCVACNTDNECPSAMRAKCDVTSHACVPCDAKAQCTHVMGGVGVCTAGNCVQCSATDLTACTGTSRPYCATNGNVCVACNVNQDCTDPTRPTCENNICRACRNEADCSGKTSGGTALDACYSGQCVDCRISTTDTKQDLGCTGSFACNPATRTCTTRAKGAAIVCGSCVADSECAANYRCVMLQFGGADRGGYCLKRQASGCEARFRVPLNGRRSLSGAAVDNYCGISEANTTCEAVSKFGTACPTQDDEECASAGAVCRNIGSWVCSYPCGTSLECQDNPPIMCPASGTDKFCRP
jgi:hypothetical protein